MHFDLKLALEVCFNHNAQRLFGHQRLFVINQQASAVGRFKLKLFV